MQIAGLFSFQISWNGGENMPTLSDIIWSYLDMGGQKAGRIWL